MNSRQRLQATLNHRQPDRVVLDLGATATTGISASALSRLREAVLGEKGFRVKVIEPYQMLGEVDADLADALGVDVLGVGGRATLFGFENDDWRPFELFDGTKVLVPGGFRVTREPNGDLLIYPGGDTSAPPSGRMPEGGFYFDAIVRQQPIDEDALDPADNLEQFAPLSDEELRDYAARAERSAATGKGVVLALPGTGFGDIALLPATGLANPRGIRDVEEWYVSTVLRKDYVRKVFEGQCEIALGNITRLADTVGDKVDVAFVSGTDRDPARPVHLAAGLP